MEDLEFQKLEREINQDEEKENWSQELLREIAECQRLTVTRKVQCVMFCDCACSMYCMYITELMLTMYHSEMSNFQPKISTVQRLLWAFLVHYNRMQRSSVNKHLKCKVEL